MKKIVLLAGVLMFSACRHRPLKPEGPTANFEFSAYEIVETPSEDIQEYVTVFINGQEKGSTEIDLKSRLKFWRTELSPGNYPMHFEVWDSTNGITGVRRADDFQPRERFVRVEPGQKTSVVLKFYDKGRQNFLYITRE